ncbi:formate dehydrogenase subunit gamma [Roseovarius spongiae]|uniref:Formate dehydrogenase subunit gamma n=1 Tax=Roseovarius spongiae TaxID=2320272 RepID=A0A3A8B7F4_9RHOB|nr:formate dehydrogenase subunit gamma [Roseovarius spongiae]RKF12653.1 formate dehydrogenase subunit gamma [Roseovarius spongiae]
MNSEVRVHGRDFTAYRIGGAIAAVLLAILLGWQIWEIFDGDNRTVPEVRWGVAALDGEATAGDQSGLLAHEVLRARTRLQDERYRSGPAPASDAPDFATGAAQWLTNAPMERGAGRDLTRGWARPGSDTLELLRGSERVAGISSLPYVGAEVFERPFGRDWRLGIADFATHLGALAILGFSLLLALVLALRGRVPIAKGRSGRTVKRFGFLERANHWMTALSFIGLALTGLVIAYGDTVIRPFSEPLLGDLGWLATWGHVLFFPPFALGILFMILRWTWGNLPGRYDARWLARGGGFFSDSPDNPPARKFNAGQKLIFWSAALGGVIMVVSGVTLMFPFYWLDIEGMSWAMLTHAVIAVLLIAIFIGHIYIGTVGMQGAIEAMWGGRVDRNWAEEHHELWLAEIEGRTPTQERSG